MVFFNQDDTFTADKIISEFKSIDKLEEQLKFVLLHLYSLDMETQEKFRNQILEYEKILSNLNFMRKVRYRDSLVEDYPSEYFGKDYGEDDPFLYNEQLEKQINQISMKLLATIGLIAKILKEKKLILPEDM